MNISPTSLAYQGIQSGFQKLADNTQQLNPNAQAVNTDNTTHAESQSTPPVKSVEEMLLSNNKTQTQIESLAKVIKTEDNLIGQLFEDWA